MRAYDASRLAQHATDCFDYQWHVDRHLDIIHLAVKDQTRWGRYIYEYRFIAEPMVRTQLLAQLVKDGYVVGIKGLVFEITWPRLVNFTCCKCSRDAFPSENERLNKAYVKDGKLRFRGGKVVWQCGCVTPDGLPHTSIQSLLPEEMVDVSRIDS